LILVSRKIGVDQKSGDFGVTIRRNSFAVIFRLVPHCSAKDVFSGVGCVTIQVAEFIA